MSIVPLRIHTASRNCLCDTGRRRYCRPTNEEEAEVHEGSSSILKENTLRYSGGHLVTPMSTRPLPYGQMATLRILRYSGGPIISVFLHIFAELRYRCQVPGCGAIIKRPWNHLNQSSKHSDLSPAAKKLNSELTKTVGLLWNEKTTTHTTANPEGVDVAEDGKQEAKKQTLEVVSTTSRQRFGDTRDMSMFPHVLSVCNLRISSNRFECQRWYEERISVEGDGHRPI